MRFKLYYPGYLMRVMAWLLVLGFVLVPVYAGETSVARGQTQTATPAVTFDGLKVEMLRTNPDLQAAIAASHVARFKAGVAGGLDAPQIGVDFFQSPLTSFPDPIKDNMENDYFIQQEIMFPAKLIAMGTAENQRAKMLEQDAKRLELRLIRNLKSSYYELNEIDEKLEINLQNLDLVNRLQAIARKQYELGMGNQSDFLRAQTEYSLLQNTQLILTQSRQSMAAEVNALLNRPIDAAVAPVAIAEPLPLAWTLGQLTELAEKNQPELKATHAGIEMSRAERGAAFWGFFPDLMARGMVKDMRGVGDNFWSLMVGVTIPIAPWSLSKYLSAYLASNAGVEQAEANSRQTRNKVLVQLQQSLTRVITNQTIAHLNRTTLLPQSEQTLQSTLAAYQTGKRDFMTLLDAYRTVWMARENYAMAIKNLLTSLADLEEIVGLSRSEIETLLKSQEVSNEKH